CPSLSCGLHRRRSPSRFPSTTLFRSEAGGDVIGVDWRLPLDAAWGRIGFDRGIQGNLDGAALLGPWERAAAGAEEVLRRAGGRRSEEHTSELQSPYDPVCRLLLEKKQREPLIRCHRPKAAAGARHDSRPMELNRISTVEAPPLAHGAIFRYLTISPIRSNSTANVS